jgi:hypothetical protein
MSDPVPPGSYFDRVRQVLDLAERAKRELGPAFGAIALALASVFGLPEQWATIVAGALLAVGLGATVYLLARRRSREAVRTEAREALAPQAREGLAFRGLSRFREGDTLPGAQRRSATAELARLALEPDRAIMVVHGESGAGKSSQLECGLLAALRRDGHAAALVYRFARPTPGQSAADAFAATLAELRRSADALVPAAGKHAFLILDQFEEPLTRFRAPAEREALGALLADLMARPVRLVIGMRKEFLADMREVAACLPAGIALQDTVPVANFTADEAQDVIRECAGRDRLVLDDALPGLIARDLAVEDMVRPADLQVVCGALHGTLTVDHYRRQGGAPGLRSRYLRTIIETTGEPVLTRALLRQLCDMPANKKVPQPQAAADLAARAREGAPGPRVTEAQVAGVMEFLEQGLVVVATNAAGSRAWSLINDYLVPPIRIATEEQSTQAESAANELKFHLAEIRAGRRKLIPLANLRTIRRHAPPALLQRAEARTILRRSLLYGYGRPALKTLAIGTLATVGVLGLATEHRWQPVDPRGSHWDGQPVRSAYRLSVTPFGSASERHLLMVAPSDDVQFPSSVWSLDSGARLHLRRERFFRYHRSDTLWSGAPHEGMVGWDPKANVERRIDPDPAGLLGGGVRIYIRTILGVEGLAASPSSAT